MPSKEIESFDPNRASTQDSGIFGLPFSEEQARLILVPVPWEATTSYGEGTSDGPQAILKASRQMDLFDLELERPYAPGIYCLPEEPLIRKWNSEAKELARIVIEAGGVDPSYLRDHLSAPSNGTTASNPTGDDPNLLRAVREVNRYSEGLNQWVHDQSRKILKAGKLLGVIGGEHSTPFGAIQAAAEFHGEIGILHFDAHADTRDAFEGFQWSHASIMRNVLTRIDQVQKLVQVGIRDFCEEEYTYAIDNPGRIKTYYDLQIKRAVFSGKPWSKFCSEMISHLPQKVWVSFDIDGLDPKLCPNTGTPVPGGLEFAEANELLRALVESGRKIIGFDLNEVAPGPNWREGTRAADEWDANVGMRMLYKLCGWTFASQGLVLKRT